MKSRLDEARFGLQEAEKIAELIACVDLYVPFLLREGSEAREAWKVARRELRNAVSVRVAQCIQNIAGEIGNGE
jgi:hypothetical protein